MANLTSLYRPTKRAIRGPALRPRVFEQLETRVLLAADSAAGSAELLTVEQFIGTDGLVDFSSNFVAVAHDSTYMLQLDLPRLDVVPRQDTIQNLLFAPGELGIHALGHLKNASAPAAFTNSANAELSAQAGNDRPRDRIPMPVDDDQTAEGGTIDLVDVLKLAGQSAIAGVSHDALSRGPIAEPTREISTQRGRAVELDVASSVPMTEQHDLSQNPSRQATPAGHIPATWITHKTPQVSVGRLLNSAGFADSPAQRSASHSVSKIAPQPTTRDTKPDDGTRSASTATWNAVAWAERLSTGASTRHNTSSVETVDLVLASWNDDATSPLDLPNPALPLWRAKPWALLSAIVTAPLVVRRPHRDAALGTLNLPSFWRARSRPTSPNHSKSG